MRGHITGDGDVFGGITHMFPLASTTHSLQVLSEPEFVGGFRAIVFPIFEDHNSVSTVNPRGCGLPFAEAFATSLLSQPQYMQAVEALGKGCAPVAGAGEVRTPVVALAGMGEEAVDGACATESGLAPLEAGTAGFESGENPTSATAMDACSGGGDVGASAGIRGCTVPGSA
jgi:hypothetical protein